MAEDIAVGVKLTGKDEGASSTLNSVRESAKSLGDQLLDMAKVAGGVALGSLVANMTQGIAANFEQGISSAMDFGQATLQLQREIGGTAESTSALLSAMEKFGVTSEDASKSLGIFSKGLAGIQDPEAAIASGGKSVQKVMSDIGVAAKDVTGAARPMNDILLDVADRFKDMPDGAEKTADAMALFGRSGKDMLFFLDQGKEGIQEAIDAAQKYGLTLTGDNLDAVKNFGLAHKDLDEAMQGLTLQVGLLVIPVLGKLAEVAAGLAEGFNANVRPAIAAFADMLEGPINRAIDVAMTAFDALRGIWLAFTVDAGAIGIVYDDIRHVFGDSIADFVQPFLQKFMDFIPTIQSWVGSIVKALTTADGTFQDSFGRIGLLLDDFKGVVLGLGTVVHDVMSGEWGVAWDDLREMAAGPLNDLKVDITQFASDALKPLQDAMSDFAPTGDRLGQLFGTIRDAIAGLIPSPLMDLVTGVGSLGDNFKDAQPAGDGLHDVLQKVADIVNALSIGIEDATKTVTDHKSVQIGLTVVAGSLAAAITLIGVQTAIASASAVGFTAVMAAMSLGMAIQTTATGLASAAMGVLNVVMEANPIGLVIVAVAGLAAGLIYAYNTIGPFHDAVDNAWQVVSTFADVLGKTATDAVNTFMTTLDGIRTFLDQASADWGAAAAGIGTAIVQGIIDGVTGAAGALFQSLKDLGSNALQAARDAVHAQSPSKDFQILGNDMGEGLNIGILESIPKVKAAATTLGDSILSEMQTFTDGMDKLIGNTGQKLQDIGTQAGQAIIDATIQAADQIKQAQDNAAQTIANAQSTITQSRADRAEQSTLETPINAEEVQHQDMRSQQQIEHQQTISLTQEQASFEKSMAAATTDAKKQQLEQQHNDKIQSINDQRTQAEAELAYTEKLAQEDRDFQAHIAQEKQDVSDRMADEALSRSIARTNLDRDTRITAIDTALDDNTKKINANADLQRQNLLKTFAQQAQDLKDQFIDKLPPLTDTAQGILNTFLNNVQGEIDAMTARVIAESHDAMAAVNAIPTNVDVSVHVNADNSFISGGVRAGGGPVTSGVGYVVGEAGPEFFVPSTDGYIVPNGGSGKLGSAGGTSESASMWSAIADKLSKAADALQNANVQIDGISVGRIVGPTLSQTSSRNIGVSV